MEVPAPAASPSTPARRNGEPQTTVVGRTKPLHRFIKGEPKSIGIAVLFLGCGHFVLGIPLRMDNTENSSTTFSTFWMGIMYITAGLLCIFCENKPSKKLVTACLSVSIVSILGGAANFFVYISSIVNQVLEYNGYFYFNTTEIDPEVDRWMQIHLGQIIITEAMFMVHSVVAGILLIVISAFAGAALRSTKTQAIIRMHNLPSE
ncbi:uncharacterized protein [Lepisosteus oculatus]|uniref:Uncharacterized LOC102687045 n=1 Tax=Lepisosteus oculatus TaxID=7918 RepID=W5N247_LEPOC|nr:PREDICTED: uncharacterized protein LOC102687045 [Lepisosteus oculatus]